MAHSAIYVRNLTPYPVQGGLSSIGLTPGNLYSVQANAMQQMGSPLPLLYNPSTGQSNPKSTQNPQTSNAIALPPPQDNRHKTLKSFLVTTAGVVTGIFLAVAIPLALFRQAFSKPVFGGFREGYRQLIAGAKYLLTVGKICRDENMAQNVRGLVRTMREFNENGGPQNIKALNQNAAKLNQFAKTLEDGGFFNEKSAHSINSLLPQVQRMANNVQNSWAGWLVGLKP